jgi:hypothetical protein
VSKNTHLDALTSHELYYTLISISQEDYYLQEFLETSLLEDLLYTLDVYDIIYIASDDRILLTSKGEKLLQYLYFNVEIEKSDVKLYKL